MTDLQSAQHAEAAARRGSGAGVLCGIAGLLVAVFGASFEWGAALLAGGVIGLVALTLGLSSSHQHGRASQWRGAAGVASVLGGVTVILVALVTLGR